MYQVSISKFSASFLEMQFETGTAAEEVLGEDLRKRMAMPYFSNASTFRNAVDRARMRAAV